LLAAQEQDIAPALARIDEALALAEQTDQRWTDAFLQRIRGDILLKADPPDFAGAEDSYLAAIAIGRQQGARSFELQAALRLARLYQSTDRPVDAHAVLAPAIEGFSPTPEMPEMAEAQALLAALAQTEAVKAADASRKRRLRLHAGYGLALTYSRGVAAEETQIAANRTKQLAAEVKDSSARFAVHYGEWLASLIAGQMESARTTAEVYLEDAKDLGALPDIASASRMLGHVRMMQGAFADARAHLEKALELCDPRGCRGHAQPEHRLADHGNSPSWFSLLAVGRCRGCAGVGRTSEEARQ
jgi:tetratricopeptide (TPR) repeat protein